MMDLHLMELNGVQICFKVSWDFKISVFSCILARSSWTAPNWHERLLGRALHRCSRGHGSEYPLLTVVLLGCVCNYCDQSCLCTFQDRSCTYLKTLIQYILTWIKNGTPALLLVPHKVSEGIALPRSCNKVHSQCSGNWRRSVSVFLESSRRIFQISNQCHLTAYSSWTNLGSILEVFGHFY